ncbi:MAG: type II secretion system F family protein [Candidatus Micrarchaeota archaeon]|nr:type II secretion system F family protein [Candidatus Micrarchaeota archaeon]
MKIEQIVKQVGGAADFSTLFSKQFRHGLGKDLAQAGIGVEPGEYASFSLTAALFAASAAALALLAIGSPVESLTILPLVFAAFLALALRYPVSRKRARAALVERDLAIALRTIAVELSIGAPFERALRTIAKSGYGELSREMRRVVADVEKGGSGVSEALKAFGQRTDSMLAKRTAMQLAFTYEQGLGSEGLRKLADELANLHKTAAREYAAKMAFFGLLFVAVSCIAPALFSAYVIVGSSFMELIFTPVQVAAAFIVFFPAADLAILYYLKKKTPAVMGF